MKKIHVVVIVIAVVILALIIGKNMVIGSIIKGGIKSLTGLGMSIDKTDVGLVSTRIGLEGIKVYNPPEFADKMMMDMPELYVDYNLFQLLKKKVHLQELRIDLKEFVVVKNKDGKLNLNSLKVVKDTKKEAEAPKEEPAKKTEFMIDVMKLKIDKVVFKDYTAGDKPKITEYPIKINEEFTNIDDPKKVANVIIAKAVMNTAIARLTDFDVNALASSASDTLKSATKVVGQTAGAAVDTGKKAADSAVKTGKKAVGTAEKAAGDAVDNTKKTIDKIINFGGSKDDDDKE
jgi:hypothetical protein